VAARGVGRLVVVTEDGDFQRAAARFFDSKNMDTSIRILPATSRKPKKNGAV